MIHNFVHLSKGSRLLAEYDGTGAYVKDYIYMGSTNYPSTQKTDLVCLSIADSKLQAEYQLLGSKYYYYTSDQINSTRIITDSSGAVVYSAVFDPYGGMQKEWVNTYSPSLKFSGKERESSSDYDYFSARYYGHNQYRFLSVDPVINRDEALVNPQLWNLYSYCGNNPISYFDPDGREVKCYSETLRLGWKTGLLGVLGTHLRHTWLEVTTDTSTTKIELGSPFVNGKGTVSVDTQKLGYKWGKRDKQSENLVDQPKGSSDNSYQFENKIIEIANAFAGDSGRDKLPVYENTGPNCNGFIRFLIEEAGGQLWWRPTPLFATYVRYDSHIDVYRNAYRENTKK